MQDRIDKPHLGQWRHDARSAVARILSSSRGVDSLAHGEALFVIQSNAKYLLGLIDELVDGVEASASDSVALATSLEQICQGFAFDADAAGISMEFHRGNKEMLVSASHAMAVSRAVSNLVSNAIEHSRATELRVEVGIEPKDAEPATLVLSVQDNGVGLHGTTPQPESDSSARGNGLGIVGDQVKKLAGSMAVDTAPGQGARFEIRVPLSQVEEPGKKEGDLQDKPFFRGRQAASSSALVVDDDPAVLEGVTAALSDLGVSCLGATSVDEALTRDLNEFGMVFLDLHLGESSGSEAARRLRVSGYHGPLVALTALPEAANEVGTLIDDCLDKLAGPSALRRAASRWLGTRSSESRTRVTDALEPVTPEGHF